MTPALSSMALRRRRSHVVLRWTTAAKPSPLFVASVQVVPSGTLANPPILCHSEPSAPCREQLFEPLVLGAVYVVDGCKVRVHAS